MGEPTPGPWTLGPYDSGPHQVHGTPVVNEWGLILAIASNKEADARLIAAAPDLLAALQRMDSEPLLHVEIRRIARAAIVKAKGEA